MKNNPIRRARAAAIACGLMSLAMPASQAFAADASAAPAPTDVTIATKSGDTHTYDVYQIFTGSVSKNDASKLSNIKAGTNANGLDTEAKVNAAAEDIAKAATGTTTDSEVLSTIEKYVDLTTTPVATVTKDRPATVKSGYYLIKDRNASVDGYDAYTLYIVKVSGNITIERKSAVPTVEKHITNDDASVGHIDLDMGDTVSYALVGTLPDNFAEYSSYKYTFNDTLSAGLTRCDTKDIHVTVATPDADVVDVTDHFKISAVNETTGLFTVSCDDVTKIAGVTSESVFTVSYTATVNDAATAAKAGNSNKVTLTFSNNPNTGGEGSTTTTPDTDESTVEVHTYDLLINKTTKTGAALAGAGFTLYKKGDDGNYTAVGSEVTGGGDAKNQFNWHGLGTGSYKLVETTTPDGYNTIKDVTFDVVTTYDGDELKGLAATNVADADGALGDNAISANVETGLMSASVVNTDGVVLPTTGATGLIILVGGAMLVFGCAGAVRLRKSGDAE